MDRAIYESLAGQNDSYILPFLQLRGEDGAAIREVIAKIDGCGIRALCPDRREGAFFTEEKWLHTFDIVMDEAKKRGMKLWIPAGLQVPHSAAAELPPVQYLSAGIMDVTGPLSRGTLDIASLMSGESAPGADSRKLLLAQAVRMPKDDMISADTAVDGSSNRIDLTDAVSGGRVLCDFPEGVWRVFAVYTSFGRGPDCTVNALDPASVDLLIDKVCGAYYERYRSEFGTVIAGFCQSGTERTAPLTDNRWGTPSMDQEMSLPWCSELPGMLEERLGRHWRELLPHLWYPSEQGKVTARVRYAYMDAVSLLRARFFSGKLGEWCASHGIGYFGRTAGDLFAYGRPGRESEHFFREMRGQSMAGIHTTDGLFSRYALTKMGASAALMEPEKEGRLVCGLFTGCGYGFGVRDMKRAVDYRIAQGVNYLAPHAFSAAEYPDGDCPPHFYCRGKNAEFPYFAELMKYSSRLCHIFSGGRWIPEVALYYHGGLGWMDDCMRDQLPAGKLKEGYIDYAIVPADALADAAGEGEGRYPVTVEDGRLVLNGVPVKLLIVPETRYADPKLLHFMSVYPDVKILFINSVPEGLEGAEAVALEQLVPKLRELGVIGARSDVKGPATFYHYVKESGDLWMVFNESRTEALSGNLLVRLKSEDQLVWRYDAMRNRVYPVEQLMAMGFDEPRMLSTLSLDPYESAVFFAATEEEAAEFCGEPDLHEREIRRKRDYSKGWSIEVAEAGENSAYRPLEEVCTAKGIRMEKRKWNSPLIPVSDVLPDFSGRIRYKKKAALPPVDPSARFVLEIEHLYEVGSLSVNGRKTDFRLCPPYRFELGSSVTEGINSFEIEVATTPLRDVLRRDRSAAGRRNAVCEPTGMFGNVTLLEL